jgi:hypothetical protein
MEAWRQADGEARAAEARLQLAWHAYENQNGAPPSVELIELVSRLRAHANGLLHQAMSLMKATR